MKVKDVRLHIVIWDDIQADVQVVRAIDQNDQWMFTIRWGKHNDRTKSQAIAIAKRLCDRFNDGQGGK